MDSSGNLDLPVGTDIRFGGDAAKSIKFDGSGNLEVPDTAELRFGNSGTKKLKFDANDNLELPVDTEIKIGTKRMRLVPMVSWKLQTMVLTLMKLVEDSNLRSIMLLSDHQLLRT